MKSVEPNLKRAQFVQVLNIPVSISSSLAVQVSNEPTVRDGSLLFYQTGF